MGAQQSKYTFYYTHQLIFPPSIILYLIRLHEHEHEPRHDGLNVPNGSHEPDGANVPNGCQPAHHQPRRPQPPSPGLRRIPQTELPRPPICPQTTETRPREEEIRRCQRH